MTIILVVGLVLVILDLHELCIPALRIEAQTHKPRYRGRFGDEAECPGLLVFKLDHVVVGADDLVGFVYRGGEEFGQGEPLARHFVAVVCVDELVVVDAVGGVAFYAGDGWGARVEGDYLERYVLVFKSWGGLE